MKTVPNKLIMKITDKEMPLNRKAQKEGNQRTLPPILKQHIVLNVAQLKD